jgi:hypothetical protein
MRNERVGDATARNVEPALDKDATVEDGEETSDAALQCGGARQVISCGRCQQTRCDARSVAGEVFLTLVWTY